MKKLVLFAAVILSMSAISCGNGEKGAATKDSVDSVDTPKVESQKGQADTIDAAKKVASVLDSTAVKA